MAVDIIITATQSPEDVTELFQSTSMYQAVSVESPRMYFDSN